MKRILVATDGSDSAGRAIDRAAALAKTAGAELLIAHVVNFDEMFDDPSLQELARAEHVSMGELLPRLSQELLASAERRARRAGATAIRTVAEHGDVAPAIMRIAEHEKVDAIVVGRRGRGRITALLLGSVSRQLTNMAPHAVIVIP